MNMKWLFGPSDLELAFAGKVFETPLKVYTDIGGGAFFYYVYKECLMFKPDGVVELSRVIVEDEWFQFQKAHSWTIYGKYRNPTLRSYNVDLDLVIPKITSGISAKLIHGTQLICHGGGVDKSTGYWTFYNEIFLLVEPPAAAI